VTHPWGTSLDNLEPHIVLIPVAVSPTNHILGFEIRRLNVAKRYFLVAKGEDSVKMLFYHAGKLVVRLEPAPFELVDPAIEETSGAGFRLIGPQVAEGFLEQMRLKEVAIGPQNLVERRPGLATHMNLPCKQDKLLAGQDPPETACGLVQLRSSDLIERIEQMPDDMELIIDNPDAGAVGLKTVTEGLPHIHNGIGHKPGTPFAEPLPEPTKALLLAPFNHVKQFGAARAFQGADHGLVVLAPAHSNLVGSHDCDAIQGARCLDQFHSGLVNVFDRPAMQRLQGTHSLVGHDFAELRNQLTQLPGHARPPDSDKREGFRSYAAKRAVDPAYPQAQKAQAMQNSQVLELLQGTVVTLSDDLAALAADIGAPRSFQVEDYGLMLITLTPVA